MFKCIERFARLEHGSAVVDWVVITSGIVTLSISVAIAVSNGGQTAATNMNATMEDVGQQTQGG